MSIPNSTAAASLRVAIVHDWLVVYAGAERVLEQLLAIYPQADLFSMVDMLPEGKRGFINNKPVTTSFIQKLPFARKHYRHYLPLMPMAVELLDLSDYDLVISSSYAVAKGVLTGPRQLHVCYCHSPIRYAWDMQQQYLRETGLDRGFRKIMANAMLHYIRLWDYRTAAGVDSFVANSSFISRRIKKVYHRGSTVIYPPIDVGSFTLRTEKDDFYLVASRLVPYKHIPLIVEAFNAMPDKKLVVIGDGPDLARVRERASANITVMGFQPMDVLRDHMQRARAFVYAAEEDFGIVPVEAQACGTPVIALGRGGLTETVSIDPETRTGVFFDQQTPEAIVEAVKRFEALPRPVDPLVCRRNAERFSSEVFRDTFRRHVEYRWQATMGGLHPHDDEMAGERQPGD